MAHIAVKFMPLYTYIYQIDIVECTSNVVAVKRVYTCHEIVCDAYTVLYPRGGKVDLTAIKIVNKG